LLEATYNACVLSQSCDMLQPDSQIFCALQCSDFVTLKCCDPLTGAGLTLHLCHFNSKINIFRLLSMVLTYEEHARDSAPLSQG